MRKLNYALQSAATVTNPKKRAMLLAGIAIEEAQTLQMLAAVLDEAEEAAESIIDPSERAQCIATVQRAMQRLGYDSHHKTFIVTKLNA